MTYIKRLLELINKFNKAAGSETNIHNSTIFLYINNKLSEIKI